MGGRDGSDSECCRTHVGTSGCHIFHTLPSVCNSGEFIISFKLYLEVINGMKVTRYLTYYQFQSKSQEKATRYPIGWDSFHSKCCERTSWGLYFRLVNEKPLVSIRFMCLHEGIHKKANGNLIVTHQFNYPPLPHIVTSIDQTWTTSLLWFFIM